MQTTNLLETSANLQKRAHDIIERTGIISIWQSIGARVNLVGSVRMGLLISKPDIDFHIYTDPFMLADSFKAMAMLAEVPGIRTIQYTNLLQAEDRCIEWHAAYEDENGDTWKLDLIHILTDSPYAGHFEKVAERILAVLTDETRLAILSIKDTVPQDEHVMGIEVYRAVIEGGVRDEAGFRLWRAEHPSEGIITWMP